ncbi:hypothetical protein JCM3765_004865 [Sporobolomyces pararoseus]
MNGPLPPRGPKHVLDLSDDEDQGHTGYKIPRKKNKRNDQEGEKGKGKGKAYLGLGAMDVDGDDEEGAFYYCNSDGELVIVDSPLKAKPGGSQVKLEGSAAAGEAGGTGKGKDAHQDFELPGGGGGTQRANEAVVAGGSKAAQLEVDPLDEAINTVCSIIPDVAQSHVRELLRFGSSTVEMVIESLLSDPNYPKKDQPSVGREREAAPDDGDEDLEEDVQKEGKTWLEVESRKPLGRDYEFAALSQLYVDFPTIQQANLKRFFSENSNFYAPTFLFAKKALEQTEAERGFKLMVSGKPRASKGKGKVDEELEKEKKWLVENVGRFQNAQLRAQQLAKQLQDEIDAGHYFECGCCFGDTAFSQIVICSEGCQFCKDCSLMNAETQIGMRKFILPCMSTSGCQATFPDSEIVKFLPRKSRDALHKIRQEKEIDLAGLEFLEKCPFCPFAYIIENEQERLFQCQRPECGVVSCRQCKKKDHLPKTCQEVSDDAKINAVHQVEEAMSSALIRKCPQCSEPYIKENDSCNKIRCASCATLSCYVCSKIITGYEHFANAGSNAPNGSEAGATCPLWDDTGRRNYEEVEAARLAAEKLAKDHPAVSQEELDRLKADAPPPPPARLAHLPPPVVVPPPPQIHRPAPPPLPAIEPLKPEENYTQGQVITMYRIALLRLYSGHPQYGAHLENYAREAGGRAWNTWYVAHDRYIREQNFERDRKRQEERARVAEVARERAVQRREEDAKKRKAVEDAREARRRRTQGKS